MGKVSEDYEKDPKYWTQFDETIDSLHIEKVVLANHKTPQNRRRPDQRFTVRCRWSNS